MLHSIGQAIYNKKGFNILALDVQEISSCTDYFIIAEGGVERHVQALSRAVLETLKELDVSVLHVDGEQEGDWIVIDCGFLLIHLFTPELREKYALERLWKEGKIVDLKISVENGGVIHE